MLNEHYTKILDKFTEWTIGVHQSSSKPGRKVGGRPRKDESENEPSKPLNGHPTVLSYKPQPTACEWCQDQCQFSKTYRRTPQSQLWDGKCNDCGESRKIHTSQIVSHK